MYCIFRHRGSVYRRTDLQHLSSGDKSNLLPFMKCKLWMFLEITKAPDLFYFTPFSALYLKGL